MASLLATQQALVTVIRNFTAALKEITAADWSFNMVQIRMEVLRGIGRTYKAIIAF